VDDFFSKPFGTASLPATSRLARSLKSDIDIVGVCPFDEL
jgi:hypothetical protein